MSEKPRRRIVWFIRIGTVLVVLYALGFMIRFWFEVWRWAKVPDDAPRIAISLDDSWLNELGITRSTYDQAMARAGGLLLTLMPPEEGPVIADEVGALLDELDVQAVLLSGGGDVDPALYGGDEDSGFLVDRLRDDFEIALIHEAMERDLPILGICRGCQILNVAFKGSLTNLREQPALKGKHFTLNGHPVNIAENSVLAKLLGTTHLDHVYSFHGQAVGTLGENVRTVATGPGDITEAIECGHGNGGVWVIGIQWHPEMALTDETQNALFEALVQAARRHRN